MTVTFFGHRDASSKIKEKIVKTTLSLIKEKGVKRFLVGAEGQFDVMVRAVLKECKKKP